MTNAASTPTALQILIVEDDLSFRKVLEIRLRGWNSAAQLTIAESIGAARTVLDSRTEAFPLVILDQHLPDGRGWELLDHPKLADSAILAVSSDDAPELPGQTLRAGAQHFLGKRQVTEPLFIPLLEALLARKKLEAELLKARIDKARLDSIKVLLATLQHEINNPLGAVLGGAYLLRAKGDLSKDQQDALKLIESSGTRIKHVVQQLCDAAELEQVTKANEQVFQVPGDKPWGSKK